MCVLMYVNTGATGGRDSKSFRPKWFCAPECVLATKLRSSAKAVNAPNHWAFFQALEKPTPKSKLAGCGDVVSLSTQENKADGYL